jgi:hypothetical protein
MAIDRQGGRLDAEGVHRPCHLRADAAERGALDTPLDTPQGGIVANFTRLETFGSRNTYWVAATIDANDPNGFKFETRSVATNVDQP